jgi:hypothetical protein
MKINYKKSIVAVVSVAIMAVMPQCVSKGKQAGANVAARKDKIVLLDYYYNNEYRKNAAGQQERWHYTWEDTIYSGYSWFGKTFTDRGAKLASLTTQPTAIDLNKASVYIIADPDTEKETATPNFMDEKAATVIADWVRQGGVLVLLTNDSGNAELQKFNTLGGKFGIHFNEDSHNRVKNDTYEQGAVVTPAGHEIFGTPKKLFIKEYSSLTLTGTARATVTHNGNNLMAVAQYGKGTVFALGDPWVYNEYTDGKKLPKDFQNYEAAQELAKWLLKQVK